VAPRGQLSVFIVGKTSGSLDLPNFKKRADNLFQQIDPYVNAITGLPGSWQGLNDVRAELDQLRTITRDDLAKLLGASDRYSKTFSDWVCGIKITPLAGSGAQVIEPIALEFYAELSTGVWESLYKVFSGNNPPAPAARAALLSGFSAYHAARARADLDGAPTLSGPLSAPPLGPADVALIKSWPQRPAWLGFDRTRQLLITKPANAQQLQQLVIALDALIAQLHDDAMRPHAQRLLAFVLDLSARIAAAAGNIAAVFLTGQDLTWTGPFDVTLDNLPSGGSLTITPPTPSDPDVTLRLTLRAMPLSSELNNARAWVGSLSGRTQVAQMLDTLASRQLFDGYTSVRLSVFRGIAAPEQLEVPASA